MTLEGNQTRNQSAADYEGFVVRSDGVLVKTKSQGAGVQSMRIPPVQKQGIMFFLFYFFICACLYAAWIHYEIGVFRLSDAVTFLVVVFVLAIFLCLSSFRVWWAYLFGGIILVYLGYLGLYTTSGGENMLFLGVIALGIPFVFGVPLIIRSLVIGYTNARSRFTKVFVPLALAAVSVGILLFSLLLG